MPIWETISLTIGSLSKGDKEKNSPSLVELFEKTLTEEKSCWNNLVAIHVKYIKCG